MGRRGPSREAISVASSGHRMTMVRVGANDGVVVLRRCLEIEGEIGGESNAGAIVSPDVLVTKQLRQFSIYCITRKSVESARMKKMRGWDTL